MGTGQVGRAAMAPGLRVLDEFAGIVRAARAGWDRGARPWLGLALGAGSAAGTVLLHVGATAPALRGAAAVTAAQPLWSEVARLPISLFVPTPDLPLWLAVAQLVVVVGLAELLFPRRYVVAVGLVGHALPTLAARFMIELGPGHFLGLPRGLGTVLDTGPSALTTAVGMWLLVRYDARRIAVGLAVALLAADRFSPGLDGREHLLALGVGLAAGTVGRVRMPRPVATPALRLRRAAVVVIVTVAGLMAWGSYQPVVAGSVVPASGGVQAVLLVSRTQLPVRVARIPAGDWLARSSRCRPAERDQGWLWTRPTYLCIGPHGATDPAVSVSVQVAGITQTQRLRAL